jgi:type II secretory pathway pseudopilin PulG
MQIHRWRADAGIAVGPILFIIAILGLLAAAIAAGSGSFTASTDTQKATAYAQAIIEMGAQAQFAVQRIIGNGYSDTEVSFEDPSGQSKRTNGTPYSLSNPNCTVDDCKVFKPDGGGIVPFWLPADAAISPSLVPGVNLHPQSFVVTASPVLNVGSDTGAEGTDLLLLIGHLTEPVCMKINDLLGIQNPGGHPPVDSFDCNSTPFTGTYSNCSNPIGDSAAALAGKQAFCEGYDASGIYYIFYQVLIAR